MSNSLDIQAQLINPNTSDNQAASAGQQVVASFQTYLLNLRNESFCSDNAIIDYSLLSNYPVQIAEKAVQNGDLETARAAISLFYSTNPEKGILFIRCLLVEAQLECIEALSLLGSQRFRKARKSLAILLQSLTMAMEFTQDSVNELVYNISVHHWILVRTLLMRPGLMKHAIPSFVRIIAALEKINDADVAWRVRNSFALAQCYLETKKYQESLEITDKGILLLRGLVGQSTNYTFLIDQGARLRAHIQTLVNSEEGDPTQVLELSSPSDLFPACTPKSTPALPENSFLTYSRIQSLLSLSSGWGVLTLPSIHSIILRKQAALDQLFPQEPEEGIPKSPSYISQLSNLVSEYYCTDPKTVASLSGFGSARLTGKDRPTLEQCVKLREEILELLQNIFLPAHRLHQLWILEKETGNFHFGMKKIVNYWILQEQRKFDYHPLSSVQGDQFGPATPFETRVHQALLLAQASVQCLNHDIAESILYTLQTHLIPLTPPLSCLVRMVRTQIQVLYLSVEDLLVHSGRMVRLMDEENEILASLYHDSVGAVWDIEDPEQPVEKSAKGKKEAPKEVAGEPTMPAIPPPIPEPLSFFHPNLLSRVLSTIPTIHTRRQGNGDIVRFVVPSSNNITGTRQYGRQGASETNIPTFSVTAAQIEQFVNQQRLSAIEGLASYVIPTALAAKLPDYVEFACSLLWNIYLPYYYEMEGYNMSYREKKEVLQMANTCVYALEEISTAHKELLARFQLLCIRLEMEFGIGGKLQKRLQMLMRLDYGAVADTSDIDRKPELQSSPENEGTTPSPKPQDQMIAKPLVRLTQRDSIVNTVELEILFGELNKLRPLDLQVLSLGRVLQAIPSSSHPTCQALDRVASLTHQVQLIAAKSLTSNGSSQFKSNYRLTHIPPPITASAAEKNDVEAILTAATTILMETEGSNELKLKKQSTTWYDLHVKQSHFLVVQDVSPGPENKRRSMSRDQLTTPGSPSPRPTSHPAQSPVANANDGDFASDGQDVSEGYLDGGEYGNHTQTIVTRRRMEQWYTIMFLAKMYQLYPIVLHACSELRSVRWDPILHPEMVKYQVYADLALAEVGMYHLHQYSLARPDTTILSGEIEMLQLQSRKMSALRIAESIQVPAPGTSASNALKTGIIPYPCWWEIAAPSNVQYHTSLLPSSTTAQAPTGAPHIFPFSEVATPMLKKTLLPLSLHSNPGTMHPYLPFPILYWKLRIATALSRALYRAAAIADLTLLEAVCTRMWNIYLNVWNRNEYGQEIIAPLRTLLKQVLDVLKPYLHLEQFITLYLSFSRVYLRILEEDYRTSLMDEFIYGLSLSPKDRAALNSRSNDQTSKGNDPSNTNSIRAWYSIGGGPVYWLRKYDLEEIEENFSNFKEQYQITNEMIATANRSKSSSILATTGSQAASVKGPGFLIDEDGNAVSVINEAQRLEGEIVRLRNILSLHPSMYALTGYYSEFVTFHNCETVPLVDLFAPKIPNSSHLQVEIQRVLRTVYAFSSSQLLVYRLIPFYSMESRMKIYSNCNTEIFLIENRSDLGEESNDQEGAEEESNADAAASNSTTPANSSKEKGKEKPSKKKDSEKKQTASPTAVPTKAITTLFPTNIVPNQWLTLYELLQQEHRTGTGRQYPALRRAISCLQFLSLLYNLNPPQQTVSSCLNVLLNCLNELQKVFETTAKEYQGLYVPPSELLVAQARIQAEMYEGDKSGTKGSVRTKTPGTANRGIRGSDADSELDPFALGYRTQLQHESYEAAISTLYMAVRAHLWSQAAVCLVNMLSAPRYTESLESLAAKDVSESEQAEEMQTLVLLQQCIQKIFELGAHESTSPLGSFLNQFLLANNTSSQSLVNGAQENIDPSKKKRVPEVRILNLPPSASLITPCSYPRGIAPSSVHIHRSVALAFLCHVHIYTALISPLTQSAIEQSKLHDRAMENALCGMMIAHSIRDVQLLEIAVTVIWNLAIPSSVSFTTRPKIISPFRQVLEVLNSYAPVGSTTQRPIPTLTDAPVANMGKTFEQLVESLQHEDFAALISAAVNPNPPLTPALAMIMEEMIMILLSYYAVTNQCAVGLKLADSAAQSLPKHALPRLRIKMLFMRSLSGQSSSSLLSSIHSSYLSDHLFLPRVYIPVSRCLALLSSPRFLAIQKSEGEHSIANPASPQNIMFAQTRSLEGNVTQENISAMSSDVRLQSVLRSYGKSLHSVRNTFSRVVVLLEVAEVCIERGVSAEHILFLLQEASSIVMPHLSHSIPTPSFGSQSPLRIIFSDQIEPSFGDKASVGGNKPESILRTTKSISPGRDSNAKKAQTKGESKDILFVPTEELRHETIVSFLIGIKIYVLAAKVTYNFKKRVEYLIMASTITQALWKRSADVLTAYQKKYYAMLRAQHQATMHSTGVFEEPPECPEPWRMPDSFAAWLHYWCDVTKGLADGNGQPCGRNIPLRVMECHMRKEAQTTESPTRGRAAAVEAKKNEDGTEGVFQIGGNTAGLDPADSFSIFCGYLSSLPPPYTYYAINHITLNAPVALFSYLYDLCAQLFEVGCAGYAGPVLALLRAVCLISFPFVPQASDSITQYTATTAPASSVSGKPNIQVQGNYNSVKDALMGTKPVRPTRGMSPGPPPSPAPDSPQYMYLLVSEISSARWLDRIHSPELLASFHAYIHPKLSFSEDTCSLLERNMLLVPGVWDTPNRRLQKEHWQYSTIIRNSGAFSSLWCFPKIIQYAIQVGYGHVTQSVLPLLLRIAHSLHAPDLISELYILQAHMHCARLQYSEALDCIQTACSEEESHLLTPELWETAALLSEKCLSALGRNQEARGMLQETVSVMEDASNIHDGLRTAGLSLWCDMSLGESKHPQRNEGAMSVAFSEHTSMPLGPEYEWLTDPPPSLQGQEGFSVQNFDIAIRLWIVYVEGLVKDCVQILNDDVDILPFWKKIQGIFSRLFQLTQCYPSYTLDSNSGFLTPQLVPKLASVHANVEPLLTSPQASIEVLLSYARAIRSIFTVDVATALRKGTRMQLLQAHLIFFAQILSLYVDAEKVMAAWETLCSVKEAGSFLLPTPSILRLRMIHEKNEIVGSVYALYYKIAMHLSLRKACTISSNPILSYLNQEAAGTGSFLESITDLSTFEPELQDEVHRLTRLSSFLHELPLQIDGIVAVDIGNIEHLRSVYEELIGQDSKVSLVYRLRASSPILGFAQSQVIPPFEAVTGLLLERGLALQTSFQHEVMKTYFRLPASQFQGPAMPTSVPSSPVNSRPTLLTLLSSGEPQAKAKTSPSPFELYHCAVICSVLRYIVSRDDVGSLLKYMAQDQILTEPTYYICGDPLKHRDDPSITVLLSPKATEDIEGLPKKPQVLTPANVPMDMGKVHIPEAMIRELASQFSFLTHMGYFSIHTVLWRKLPLLLSQSPAPWTNLPPMAPSSPASTVSRPSTPGRSSSTKKGSKTPVRNQGAPAPVTPAASHTMKTIYTPTAFSSYLEGVKAPTFPSFVPTTVQALYSQALLSLVEGLKQDPALSTANSLMRTTHALVDLFAAVDPVRASIALTQFQSLQAMVDINEWLLQAISASGQTNPTIALAMAMEHSASNWYQPGCLPSTSANTKILQSVPFASKLSCSLPESVCLDGLPPDATVVTLQLSPSKDTLYVGILRKKPTAPPPAPPEPAVGRSPSATKKKGMDGRSISRIPSRANSAVMRKPVVEELPLTETVADEPEPTPFGPSIEELNAPYDTKTNSPELPYLGFVVPVPLSPQQLKHLLHLQEQTRDLTLTMTHALANYAGKSRIPGEFYDSEAQEKHLEATWRVEVDTHDPDGGLRGSSRGGVRKGFRNYSYGENPMNGGEDTSTSTDSPLIPFGKDSLAATTAPAVRAKAFGAVLDSQNRSVDQGENTTDVTAFTGTVSREAELPSTIKNSRQVQDFSEQAVVQLYHELVDFFYPLFSKSDGYPPLVGSLENWINDKVTSHVVLCVERSLSSIPFELLPCFQSDKFSISRDLSLQTIGQRHMSLLSRASDPKNATGTHTVSAEDSVLLLDPYTPVVGEGDDMVSALAPLVQEPPGHVDTTDAQIAAKPSRGGVATPASRGAGTASSSRPRRSSSVAKIEPPSPELPPEPKETPPVTSFLLHCGLQKTPKTGQCYNWNTTIVSGRGISPSPSDLLSFFYSTSNKNAVESKANTNSSKGGAFVYFSRTPILTYVPPHMLFSQHSDLNVGRLVILLQSLACSSKGHHRAYTHKLSSLHGVAPATPPVPLPHWQLACCWYLLGSASSVHQHWPLVPHSAGGLLQGMLSLLQGQAPTPSAVPTNKPRAPPSSKQVPAPEPAKPTKEKYTIARAMRSALDSMAHNSVHSEASQESETITPLEIDVFEKPRLKKRVKHALILYGLPTLTMQ